MVDELLHHLECKQPCKSWNKLPSSAGKQDFFLSTGAFDFFYQQYHSGKEMEQTQPMNSGLWTVREILEDLYILPRGLE